MTQTSSNKARDGSTVLIKGDISGIQEFIFSVSSKRAAKALKARSEYVVDCERRFCKQIINQFKGANPPSFFGGGGFYIGVDKTAFNTAVIEQQQKAIDMELKNTGLDVVLSYSPVDKMNSINKASIADKMRKLQSLNDAFAPFIIEYSKDGERKFIENFRKSNADRIKKKLPKWSNELHKNYKDKFETLKFTSDEKPPEVNETINFHFFAEFAYEVTGSRKLGVLKMDLDNMREHFREKSFAETHLLSKEISGFFPNKINDILQSKDEYKYGIYPVFVGGDDCFFIGRWDMIMKLALEIHTEFDKYFDLKIKKHLANNSKPITISGGIIVVDDHFPVVQMAHEAESALNDAKERKTDGEKVKNAISVFGEVLTWNEFSEAKDICNILTGFIEKDNQARSLLERIQDTADDFDILQGKALKGEFQLPEIWRLYYYLRNIKNKELRDSIDNKILTKYQEYLMNAYTEKITVNPVIFPIAARWAELKTKH